MWGQTWGQMIWGRAPAVPASTFWGIMIAAVTLLLLGLRLSRRRPRIVGLVAVALALAVPLSARALSLPFTFVNNTVADANQVNANFAALASGPQVFFTGMHQVPLAPFPGVTVASLSLPAGSYVLYAKLRYEGTGTTTAAGQACVFQGVGVGGLDASQANVPPGGEASGQVDGVMMDVVTKHAGDPADVHVQCFGQANVQVINSRLVALSAQITAQ